MLFCYNENGAHPNVFQFIFKIISFVKEQLWECPKGIDKHITYVLLGIFYAFSWFNMHTCANIYMSQCWLNIESIQQAIVCKANIPAN